MEAIGSILAALAVVLMLIIDVMLVVKGMREGSCAVGGWGVFRRESAPVGFWICMAFHLGIGVALLALLAAAAVHFFFQ